MIRTNRFDTYGFPSVTLEESTARLMQVLNLAFEERHSSYYGGSYFMHRSPGGAEMKVFSNLDQVSGFWIRSQWSAYTIIAEVSNLEEMDRLQQLILNEFPHAALLHTRTSTEVENEDDSDT